MADVGSTAVALDVGQPLVLGRVGVTGTDVTGLQGLEILEGAKLVGHFGWIGLFRRLDVLGRRMEWRLNEGSLSDGGTGNHVMGIKSHFRGLDAFISTR